MRASGGRRGSEFVSALEKIMPAKELLFDPTPGFGPYRRFLEHAMAHPAKMNTLLLRFLIAKFTRPGDTILDPMCGSGSCGVVGALLGRNVIQVDIEERFVEWAEEARRRVERYLTLIPKGRIVNIRGDSRRLSELLRERVDAIVTSPPYSETMQAEHDPEKELRRLQRKLKQGMRLSRSTVEVIKRGRWPPYGIVVVTQPYSDNLKNIGNLPHGEIDAVITSPPCTNRAAGEKLAIGGIHRLSKGSIANPRRETYLEAMLKVYGEMWKVLKPGGPCIVVVKPFIRGGEIVDLPYQTWLLMEKVGFRLVELYKLRLRNISFWRVIYEREHPSVPKLRHEYVLVCRKPAQGEQDLNHLSPNIDYEV